MRIHTIIPFYSNTIPSEWVLPEIDTIDHLLNRQPTNYQQIEAEDGNEYHF